MMSAHLPEVIDERMLCCPLCSNEAQHPKVLPCLHIFCEKCLDAYVDQYRKTHTSETEENIEPQYQTLPSTTKTPPITLWERNRFLDEAEHFGNSDKRDSGYSENGTRRKLRRSRDRTVLSTHGEYYRTRFKQQRTDLRLPLQDTLNQLEKMKTHDYERVQGKDAVYEMNDEPSHDSSEPSLIRTYKEGRNPCKRSQSEMHIKTPNDVDYVNNSTVVFGTNKNKATTLDSKTERVGKNAPLKAGHVSDMVHMFERRNSFVEATPAPPMAKFRVKSSSKDEPLKSFVPLSQRALPVYNSHVFRSKSHDPTAPALARLQLPRNNSVSTQGSGDSAIGTAEADVFSPVFETACKFAHSSTKERPKLKSPDEQPATNWERNSGLYQYESNECPKSIIRQKENVQRPPNLLSRLESGEYDLATAVTHVSGVNEHYNVQMRTKPIWSNTSDKRTSSIESEHIYDEIPALYNRESRIQSIRQSRLRSESFRMSKDDNDLPRSRLSQRRNSSTLDSFILAGGSASDNASLNIEIPLSNDDSDRLSALYLRMDSTNANRLSINQRYVAMDGLKRTQSKVNSRAIIRQLSVEQRYVAMDEMHQSKPVHSDQKSSFDESNPSTPVAESVDVLIRQISAVYGSISDYSRTKLTKSESIEEVPEERPESPIYMNTPTNNERQTVYKQGDQLDLDTDEPIYDRPASPRPVKDFSDHIYDNPESLLKNDSDYATIDEIRKVDFSAPCPQCSRKFELPNGLVSDLVSCDFAAQLQEVVNNQKCARKNCSNCESREASHHCLDCFADLCQGCRSGHNWSRSNRGHKVVTLYQMQSGKYQQEMRHSQKTICQRDLVKQAMFVCVQCEKIQCSDCTLEHCSHHRSLSIADVAERDTDFIQSKQHDLMHRQELFQGAIHQVSTYVRHCRSSMSSVLDQVRAHQDYIHLLLDQSFDLLSSKVKQIYETEVERVEPVQQAIMSSLNRMNHVNTFVDQLLEHGNHGNIVSMAPLVKEEFTRLGSETVPSMSSELDVKFTTPELNFSRIQKLCGDVRQNLRPIEQSQQRTRDSQLTEHHTALLEHVCHFNSKVAGDTKGCRPNGVCILPNNNIVIVDNINMKLKIFDTKGVLQGGICPQGSNALIDPWDVAVLHDGTLAVTDKGAKCVKLFKDDGKFVNSFGGHFKQPWGICTNSRDELLVTDAELGQVFIHDSYGKLLHKFPDPKSKKPWKLKCPEYIICNDNDDIIVSDFEQHCILVFDLLGRPLFRFGRKGTGWDEFYYPLGVATDHHGNIYIINYKNERITVSKRNGQFVCCLQTSMGLHSLQAISVDNNGHLVVVDGSMVKIFKLPHKIAGNDDELHDDAERSDVLILEELDNAEPYFDGGETTV